MQELRNEQAIYRAALALIMQLAQPKFDTNSVQQLMKTIVGNIKDWPRQWKREILLSLLEPKWKLSSKSL
ncbi:MAG: hypothetical protein ABI076_07275 [Acidobacteriaceae bacterium]